MDRQGLGFFYGFLRLFFRLLYHEMAWTYDFVAAFVSGGRWARWRDSMIPFVQGHNVLELGFGPGHLLHKLQQGGFNVIGLDASRQMARLARKNLQRAGLTSQLVRGDGQHLPFCNAAFDSVVATFPTNYAFLPSTLFEVRRVLRPNGCLVFLISAWITDRSIASRFLAWLFRVTGQVLPDQFDPTSLLAPFQAAQLNSRVEWVEMPGSRLLIIVASQIPD